MGTRIFTWDKGGWCLGLANVPPTCAGCLEIWESRPSGTLRAWTRIALHLIEPKVHYRITPKLNTILSHLHPPPQGHPYCHPYVIIEWTPSRSLLIQLCMRSLLFLVQVAPDSRPQCDISKFFSVINCSPSNPWTPWAFCFLTLVVDVCTSPEWQGGCFLAVKRLGLETDHFCSAPMLEFLGPYPKFPIRLAFVVFRLRRHRGVPRGVGGFTPPPPKFRSFDKAKPNSLFRGKYVRNNLIRIRVSHICKLSRTLTRGLPPQIPVLSALCPHLNLLNPPPEKIPGYATA
jgi:hypothetical protein